MSFLAGRPVAGPPPGAGLIPWDFGHTPQDSGLLGHFGLQGQSPARVILERFMAFWSFAVRVAYGLSFWP
jgi:hypothetical protein